MSRTRLIAFVRSTRGRLAQVGCGTGLLWYGALQGSLAGLCLMMAGVLPLVAGISNEYPFDSYGPHTR